MYQTTKPKGNCFLILTRQTLIGWLSFGLCTHREHIHITHLETSSLPMNGCKIYTHVLGAGRDFNRATSAKTLSLGFCTQLMDRSNYVVFIDKQRIFWNYPHPDP